jgi:hypothetical protein
MDQVPLWLHRPLKRFIQYWGVVLASFPAGILYLVLLGMLGPNPALIFTLPVALACAYFTWRWLDRRLVFSRPDNVVFISMISPTSTAMADPRFSLAGGSLVLVMIATAGSRTAITNPLDQPNVAIGGYSVVSDTHALT